MGKDTGLGKRRAPNLLLSGAQKFVPDAEQPTRALDIGVTIEK